MSEGSANRDRVWFITGSSTGFGRALAEVALERGERALATAHEPERGEELDGLPVLPPKVSIARA